MKFNPDSKNIEYNLATVFEVVVPQLDNYSYTLMILYSRPETDYPVAISVGSNIIDDSERFYPQYECRDREEFIGALKNVLSSEEVNRNISILYSKAEF